MQKERVNMACWTTGSQRLAATHAVYVGHLPEQATTDGVHLETVDVCEGHGPK